MTSSTVPLRSGPAASISWLTWRSIGIGAIVAVILGGVIGINAYGQYSDAIQSRANAVARAKSDVVESQKQAQVVELERNVQAAQDKFNRILQGDRSGCPIPDDPTSSDCYVGLAEELKYAQDALQQGKDNANVPTKSVQAAQRNLNLANSELQSFKLYAGIISALIGIAAGLVVFGIALLVTWGHWRNRLTARKIVIGSVVATGIGIVTGVIVGFLDYTSPTDRGYSCQARDAAGRGLDCARNAIIHGERVGLLITVIGIGIAVAVVFGMGRKAGSGGVRPDSEEGTPLEEAPPSQPAVPPVTKAPLSSKPLASRSTSAAATAPHAPTIIEAANATPSNETTRDRTNASTRPTTPRPHGANRSAYGGFFDSTVDIFTRADGSERSIKRGFSVAGFAWGLIFGFFWPLSHRLWLQAGVVLVLLLARLPVGALVASRVSADNSTTAFLVVFFGVPVALALWMGLYGNTWRRGRAVKDGFKPPPGVPFGSLELFPSEYQFDGKMRGL